MNIEIWLRDEYGGGSILGRFPTPEAAWDRALAHLYSVNCDNALTALERRKSWECYLPVCMKDGQIDKSMMFDENKVGRDPRFVNASGDSKSATACDCKMLANAMKSKDPWFISDFKERGVVKLDDPALKTKAYLFFKLS